MLSVVVILSVVQKSDYTVQLFNEDRDSPLNYIKLRSEGFGGLRHFLCGLIVTVHGIFAEEG